MEGVMLRKETSRRRSFPTKRGKSHRVAQRPCLEDSRQSLATCNNNPGPYRLFRLLPSSSPSITHSPHATTLLWDPRSLRYSTYNVALP